MNELLYGIASAFVLTYLRVWAFFAHTTVNEILDESARIIGDMRQMEEQQESVTPDVTARIIRDDDGDVTGVIVRVLTYEIAPTTDELDDICAWWESKRGTISRRRP